MFCQFSNSQNILPYKVGAYYFGGWHQNFYGGLKLSTAYEPNQKEMPSYGSSADFWAGPRHIYNNSAWFYEKIPNMLSSNYRKSFRPLLGYYDLLDQRVMDTHIKMAASRGLSFFAFYFTPNSLGKQTEASSVAINSFIASQNKYGMKICLSLELIENPNCTSWLNYRDTLVREVAKYILNQTQTSIDTSYLTLQFDSTVQPVLIDAMSPWINFCNNPSYHHEFIAHLKDYIYTRTGKELYILMRTPSQLETECNIAAYYNIFHNANNRNYKIVDGFTSLIGNQGIQPYDASINGLFNYDSLAARSYQGSLKWNSNLTEVGSSGSFNNNILRFYNNTCNNSTIKIPYVPSIATGYDIRPWGHPSNQGWFTNNTPTGFNYFLKSSKNYLDFIHQNITTIPSPFKPIDKMLLIYAWNEWGESGILEPSEANEYKYLDAISEILFNNFINTNYSKPYNGTLDLNLLFETTTYWQWQATKTFPNNQNQPEDDPDNDGFANILEYAFNMQPNLYDLSLINTSTCDSIITSPCYYKTSNLVKLRYNRDFKKTDIVFHEEIVVSSIFNSSGGANISWWYYDKGWNAYGLFVGNTHKFPRYTLTPNTTIQNYLVEYDWGGSGFDFRNIRLVLQMPENSNLSRFYWPITKSSKIWTGNANNSQWGINNNWDAISIPITNDQVFIPTNSNTPPNIYYPILVENKLSNTIYIRNNGKIRVSNGANLIIGNK